MEGKEPRSIDIKVEMQDCQVASMDTVLVRLCVARPPRDEPGECPPVDLCEACRAVIVLRAGLKLASGAGLRSDWVLGVKQAVDVMAGRSGLRGEKA